jgi:hypothetical protein
MSPTRSAKSPKQATATTPQAVKRAPTPRAKKRLETADSPATQPLSNPKSKTSRAAKLPPKAPAIAPSDVVKKGSSPAKRSQSKSAPIPAAEVPEAMVKVARPTAKRKRTSQPSKPQVQETPAAVDTSDVPMVTSPASVARAPIPEPELWEKDSPVMRRISLLRTRNAQLSEQVHRLKKPA